MGSKWGLRYIGGKGGGVLCLGSTAFLLCYSLLLSVNFKRMRIFIMLVDMLRRRFSFCAVICGYIINDGYHQWLRISRNSYTEKRL